MAGGQNKTAAPVFQSGGQGNGVGRLKLFRGDHPGRAGVIEQAAGIHHRAHIAERFEMIDLAGFFHGHGRGIEIHGHDVAGFQNVAEAFGEFARIQFAGGDAIAKKDARETFREHELAIGGTHCNGRVFARAAAAKVFAADDDGKVAVELAFRNVADGIK